MNDFLKHLECNLEELDVTKLNNIVASIEEKRLEMRKTFPREHLLVYEEKFLNLTKQIKNKIDSVIEKISIEQKSVQNELNKLANKKKLIIYGR